MITINGKRHRITRVYKQTVTAMPFFDDLAIQLIAKAKRGVPYSDVKFCRDRRCQECQSVKLKMLTKKQRRWFRDLLTNNKGYELATFGHHLLKKDVPVIESLVKLGLVEKLTGEDGLTEYWVNQRE